MTKKFTYADIIAEWKRKNIAWNVTEAEYAGMNTKSKAIFHCTIHSGEVYWETELGVMRKGKSRCKQCKTANKTKKTKEEIDELLLSMGVVRLEVFGDRSAKGKFRCIANPDHEWEETTQQITMRGYGCYMCRGKIDHSRVYKLYESDVLPKIQELGYTLLSNYESTDRVGEFCCSKGHRWKTTIGNVYRELSGCPICSSRSSEARAILIIEKLLNAEFKKTRSVLPSGLELDGYNAELMLAIEYNGAQHYMRQPTLFHREEGAFEAQQARDERKKIECVELGIELITVHHKLNTFDKIREYIEAELLRLGYTIHRNLDWDELKRTLNNNCDFNIDSLNQIKAIVESKNGECLSANYTGRLDPMWFKCDILEHPAFERTPAAIRDNKWCIHCPSAKITCECGSTFGVRGMNRHKTSKTHIDWVTAST